MREDDEELRHYAPLLRRIIVLVAVLTAVPVILWTITAAVRSYVGPPKLPIFRQLAATEPTEAPAAAMPASTQPQSAPDQSNTSGPSSAVEARATATDARDLPTAMQMSDGPPAAPASPKAADMLMAASAPTPAAPDTAASTGALAAQPPAAASELSADALPAATPLSGPIPLPRRRPHVIAEAPMTQIAQTNVPIPRPRPDGASPTVEPETNAQPLEFLQNIFH